MLWMLRCHPCCRPPPPHPATPHPHPIPPYPTLHPPPHPLAAGMMSRGCCRRLRSAWGPAYPAWLKTSACHQSCRHAWQVCAWCVCVGGGGAVWVDWEKDALQQTVMCDLIDTRCLTHPAGAGLCWTRTRCKPEVARQLECVCVCACSHGGMCCCRCLRVQGRGRRTGRRAAGSAARSCRSGCRAYGRMLRRWWRWSGRRRPASSR